MCMLYRCTKLQNGGDIDEYAYVYDIVYDANHHRHTHGSGVQVEACMVGIRVSLLALATAVTLPGSGSAATAWEYIHMLNRSSVAA